MMDEKVAGYIYYFVCCYLYMGLNLGQQRPPFRYGTISRKMKTLKDKQRPFEAIFGSGAKACERSLMECQQRRKGKCFLNAFAKKGRLLSIIFSLLVPFL